LGTFAATATTTTRRGGGRGGRGGVERVGGREVEAAFGRFGGGGKVEEEGGKGIGFGTRSNIRKTSEIRALNLFIEDLVADHVTDDAFDVGL